jgi:hypothetical protein
MSLSPPSPRSIPSEPERNADAVEALEGDTERAGASLCPALALVGETPLAATISHANPSRAATLAPQTRN